MKKNWLVFFSLFFVQSGFAADEPENSGSNQSQVVSPASSETASNEVANDGDAGSRRRSKGRVTSEKEAAGTKAPNRFGTSDAIIKSKHPVNGQFLEVDTD